VVTPVGNGRLTVAFWASESVAMKAFAAPTIPGVPPGAVVGAGVVAVEVAAVVGEAWLAELELPEPLQAATRAAPPSAAKIRKPRRLIAFDRDRLGVTSSFGSSFFVIGLLEADVVLRRGS